MISLTRIFPGYEEGQLIQWKSQVAQRAINTLRPSVRPSIHPSVYLTTYLPIYLSMVLEPIVGPWPLFECLNLYTVGMTPWTGDQPVATQTQNRRTQTSIPLVGFEPAIPLFKRAKTVHDSDRAATVIGSFPDDFVPKMV
jgi:hypothetical protein